MWYKRSKNEILRCHFHSSAATSASTNKETDNTSVKDLKATGKVIERLEEGWQSIHGGNLENFEKSRVNFCYINHHLST